MENKKRWRLELGDDADRVFQYVDLAYLWSCIDALASNLSKRNYLLLKSAPDLFQVCLLEEVVKVKG
jgi:hypothetical protein